MTDTGQVPAEGQPESVGMVEQPGAPAHGAYTYLSEAPAEDEELLLPGAQGAWGNEVQPPAPEPVVEAIHEPGAHETGGRDSGSVDLNGVRLPNPAPPSVPPSPILSAPHDPAVAAQPRRPLHLGPPIPDTSASPVRSLADRGPAGAPVRQPGPPTTGPEYLDAQPLRDMAPQSAAPWGAAPAAVAQVGAGAQAAETVSPAVTPFADAAVAAQAAAPPLAVQAVAQAPGEGVQEPARAEVVHGHDGTQPVQHGHDGVYTAPAGQAPEGVHVPPEAGQEAPVAPPAPVAQEPAEAVTAADGGAAPVTGTPTAPEAGQQADGVVPAPQAAAADPGAEAVGGAETPAGAQVTPVPVQQAQEEAVPVQAAPVVQAPDAVRVAEPVAPSENVQPQPVEGAEPADATQTQGAEGTDAPTGAVPVDAVPQDADAVAAGVLPQTVDAVAAGAVPQAADSVAPGAVPQASGVLQAEGVPQAAVAAGPVPQDVAAVQVEGVPQVVGAVPVEAMPQAADAVQAQGMAAEADAVTAHGRTEGVDAGVAQVVAHAADAVADAVADAGAVQGVVAGTDEVAAQAVPQAADPAVLQAADPAVREAADPAAAQPVTEPAGVVPAQADPQVSGAVAAQAAPAGPGTAAADPAQVPTIEPAADSGQAPPAADPAQVPESVAAVPAADGPQTEAVAAAPGVEEAQAEPVAVAPGADEPHAVTVVSPEQDAVQAPPAADGTATPAAGTPAATEVPEPVPLQAQGPQLAGPVPNEGEAVAAAQRPPEPSHVQQTAQGEGAPGATPIQPPAPAAPAGPQLQPGQGEPAVQQGDPGQPVPGAADSQPSAVPGEPQPEQPLGQFVPVEGSVPTTPHLAPTPPQPLVLPAQERQEPVVTVPAPREAEPAAVPAAPDDEHVPDVVQHAEDLETRAAEQEESTAAVEEVRQPSGPAAPAYDDAEREAILKVMRERRDIRNGFRGDPIPHEVLLRVLEAAHTAPSVGHSQPWDFVVIRSAETRSAMHELAQRQREAYAKSLPKGRAKQFKELKIEAILDTPVNIVVTADPTRGGRHTLGRHTQPQMAPYSAALAVENLWLAARAEGLGVGWVSFFDEREMVRALGLPEHLEVIAYLCVGYVDEFPDEPELMQAGWSKRRPLSWVVHEETYGRRALPGEEPHDLLAETVAQIRPLDAKALGEAWERQKRMTKPAGALGMLEIISAQLSGLSRQCPPPIPEPAAVAIFAGDHGVHAQGVTPWPQEVTAQMVANFLGGGAVCNAFASQVGAEVCVVDVGVAADLPATPGLLPRKIRGGTSDMTTGPAMTREEAKAAIEVGIETSRDLVAAGNKALLTGEMGIANTTASAALIAVFTGADPAEVTGRGTGINDETLARKTEVVRRVLELHQPDPADPVGVLAAIGGFEHAALVGLLLGGASLRTPVILDGVSAGAAALVARAIAPEVLAACIAGHRSAEPGHVAALNKLGLRPLVDLDLRLGEGTGALLALPLVQSTARAMHEVATFDSAGVTEK